MRTLRRALRLGSYISSFSRRYFLTLAISAMAVTSSYLAGFPYDNLCQNENAAKANGDGDDDGNAIEDYNGTWDTERIDGSRSM